MCPPSASGHSGQPPGGGADPPFTRNPNYVPLEVLRDFVGEQARLHSYRVLAALWGVGHETLRKFAMGRTAQPHPRQREVYGARFLELHPSGYVREKRVDGRAGALQQLKMLLPPDREEAAEVLDRIFALAARHPDELPDQTNAVRAWMRKLLAAEFDAETRYPRLRRPPSPDD